MYYYQLYTSKCTILCSLYLNFLHKNVQLYTYYNHILSSIVIFLIYLFIYTLWYDYILIKIHHRDFMFINVCFISILTLQYPLSNWWTKKKKKNWIISQTNNRLKFHQLLKMEKYSMQTECRLWRIGANFDILVFDIKLCRKLNYEGNYYNIKTFIQCKNCGLSLKSTDGDIPTWSTNTLISDLKDQMIISIPERQKLQRNKSFLEPNML